MTETTSTAIIKSNLELMVSRNGGGMPSVLRNESMGNAGFSSDGHPCRGVNFYFDQSTGKIVYFGNCQNVPLEVKAAPQNAEGTFKVVMDQSRQCRSEIVGAYYRPAGICARLEYLASTRNISDFARYVLLKTIEAYNRR